MEILTVIADMIKYLVLGSIGIVLCLMWLNI